MEATVKRRNSIALFLIVGVAVFSTIGVALKLLVEISNQPVTIFDQLGRAKAEFEREGRREFFDRP